MPASEASFLQRAHPGKTEWLSFFSVGHINILDLFSLFGGSEVVEDPSARPRLAFPFPFALVMACFLFSLRFLLFAPRDLILHLPDLTLLLHFLLLHFFVFASPRRSGTSFQGGLFSPWGENTGIGSSDQVSLINKIH